jgi:hypothetical protein
VVKEHNWTDDPPRELVTRGKVRTVEDVQALPLASQDELDRVLPKPKPKPNHHGRGRRAQLRMDAAGVPCKCSETTACLAHHAISGRRRFIRPD